MGNCVTGTRTDADASRAKPAITGTPSLLDVLMPDEDQDFDFDPPKADITMRPMDLDG